jgi:hypothetical protein
LTSDDQQVVWVTIIVGQRWDPVMTWGTFLARDTFPTRLTALPLGRSVLTSGFIVSALKTFDVAIEIEVPAFVRRYVASNSAQKHLQVSFGQRTSAHVPSDDLDFDGRPLQSGRRKSLLRHGDTAANSFRRRSSSVPRGGTIKNVESNSRRL